MSGPGEFIRVDLNEAASWLVVCRCVSLSLSLSLLCVAVVVVVVVVSVCAVWCVR